MAGFVALLPGHAEAERLAQSTPAFLGCVYATQTEQESCASAACSRPRCAGIARNMLPCAAHLRFFSGSCTKRALFRRKFGQNGCAGLWLWGAAASI